MHTFITNHILNDQVTLDEQESKHAIKVLRLKNGDLIKLVDGTGNYGEAEIIQDHPKHCLARMVNVNFSPKPTDLVIALAPTKNNDRTDFFLEKAIEIGITKFIPLLCDNSERTKVNIDRWERIAIAALKQSQQLWKTQINSPISFDQIFSFKQKINFIAHCENDLKTDLIACANRNRSQLILIGPEGDFSEREITLAAKESFTAVSLGNTRLRTETAGIVAAALMTAK